MFKLQILNFYNLNTFLSLHNLNMNVIKYFNVLIDFFKFQFFSNILVSVWLPLKYNISIVDILLN